MKRITKHIPFVTHFFYALLLTAVLLPYAVSADTASPLGGTVVVRPAKSEVSIAPGGEKQVGIRVGNDTLSPLHIEASFEDVASSVQTSAVDDPVRLLGGTNGVYSLKDLLDIPQASFDLLPGKEVEIFVTIRIPKDAEPGGRYGSVVFQFSPITHSAGAGANVSLESRIAALLYVRIAGETKEEGRLVAFGLFNNAKTTMSPTPSSPLRMQVAYENTGAVHTNPYGRIIIRSLLGKTYTLMIDPWAVLPGATRMREIDMTEPLTPGYYALHLEQNRGYNDIVDKRDVIFWVLPSGGQLFITLICLLLFFFILRKSFRLSRHSI
jgi:hypothetical protein